MAQRRIVVGVDGSDHARHALQWALTEARLRGASVHLIHGWAAVSAAMDPTGQSYEMLQEGGEAVLAEAEAAARAEGLDGVEITSELVAASPAEALLEASRDAELVVVGARGTGGFLGLLVGSVSDQVLRHAHCPAVVVR